MENSNSFTRIILLGFTVLILSISSKAYSALAEADWMIGDKAITIDDNGLRWLDLSFTRAQTYNQVTAQLAAGQIFDGFRYATSAELAELFNSAGGNGHHYTGWSTVYNGVFKTLAPLWGDLCDQLPSCNTGGLGPGNGQSQVITGDISLERPNSHYMTTISDTFSDNISLTQDFISLDQFSIEDTGHSQLTAHALVQVSAAVAIDIKPGSDPVCNGAILVAILGSVTLDVIQIDQTTLSFEGLDVRERGNGALSCNIWDTNRDGFADLVCQYQDNTTEGTLTGELLDGTLIEGADTFCVVH